MGWRECDVLHQKATGGIIFFFPSFLFFSLVAKEEDWALRSTTDVFQDMRQHPPSRN
jgi:hypothetical protein